MLSNNDISPAISCMRGATGVIVGCCRMFAFCKYSSPPTFILASLSLTSIPEMGLPLLQRSETTWEIGFKRDTKSNNFRGQGKPKILRIITIFKWYYNILDHQIVPYSLKYEWYAISAVLSDLRSIFSTNRSNHELASTHPYIGVLAWME